MKLPHTSVIPVAIVMALCVSPVIAESISGTILGIVRDRSGASVPGAMITLRDEKENTSRTRLSGSEGAFEFVDLKPGPYELKVEKEGFNAAKVTVIELSGQRSVRADVELSIANVREQISVAEPATLVHTDDDIISDSKSGAQIGSLLLN